MDDPTDEPTEAEKLGDAIAELRAAGYEVGLGPASMTEGRDPAGNPIWKVRQELFVWKKGEPEPYYVVQLHG